MLSREFSLEEANALLHELDPLVGDQLKLGQTISELVRELRERVPVERRTMDVRELADHGESIGLDAEDISDLELDQGQVVAEVVDITLRAEDPGEIRDIKRNLAAFVEQYREGWQQVAEAGAVVADTSSGVIECFGRLDGRPVWFSWQYGEPAVEHYHELNESVSERRPLGDARARLLN
ncbi:MAG: DUF2203 family protein [Myxococcota bacterium]